MSVVSWLALFQEIGGKPLAPSWGAWAGLIFGGGSFLILVFDRIVGRGKSLQGLDSKIDKLCEEVDELKETQGVMDRHLESLSESVRTLTHEWRGVDGKNGWRSVVRELRHDVTEIQKRNLAHDAITQYEQEQLRKRGKEPQRLRDKINPDDT